MHTLSRYKKWFLSLTLLAGWYLLMLTDVGGWLAGLTIGVLIVGLFVCGCVTIRPDGKD